MPRRNEHVRKENITVPEEMTIERLGERRQLMYQVMVGQFSFSRWPALWSAALFHRFGFFKRPEKNKSGGKAPHSKMGAVCVPSR